MLLMLLLLPLLLLPLLPLLLLLQEYVLRMTAMGWFVGLLTYEQLSRLAIQTYPYPMRVLFLGTEVMKHREKLEQQRLQLLL
jgi:hypothetical protein